MIPVFLEQKTRISKILNQCDQRLVDLHIETLIMSDFLVDSFLRFPDWLKEMNKNSHHQNDHLNYQSELDQLLLGVSTEEQLMVTLRHFRRKKLVNINWAQITGSSTTEHILMQLSVLAEVIIISTRDWLYQLNCQAFGTPYDDKQNPQPMLILGMGKLGGGELNFSSDVDLIFTYPNDGIIKGGRRELSNAMFFIKLGQKLIKVLSQITQDGFVYRVDMRLRPLGEGGPLVLSFAAMENYYQEQGRDWERYAMVKAKVLGDQNSVYVKELYHMLKPFVYRRYIDFSVLQSLRDMKVMIEREVRRRQLTDNIKLGSGGIREIEFIVQVFQLIRGGRIVSLQTRSLLNALKILASENFLTHQEIAFLHDNYLFLRRCENLLQGIDDRQEHTLPRDKLNQARIASGMGFNSWNDFYHSLTEKMQITRCIFKNLIHSDEVDNLSNNANDRFNELWGNELQSDEINSIFPDHNSDESLKFYQLILQFKEMLTKRTIGARGRTILEKLMPAILSSIYEQNDNRLVVLKRVFQLLINIVSRTTYLELLVEYPTALKQLIRLCAASPMVSDQLTRYPLLLDELIDFNSLYKTLPIDAYKSELHQYLLRLAVDDDESQIEGLREFKQMQLLRIAASDIADILPTMKVSDHLTYLAEAILDSVVNVAWNQMIKRYGKPDYLMDESQKGLLIIGYGKLGGIELGYGSDLDLVFLHDCPDDSFTNGDKSIHGHQFYLRLVQRIIHLFNMRTNSGILYEIDVRLRPQGDAGLLVSSLEQFETYQNNDAWTWEHQALVRARIVYGETRLQSYFKAVRHHALSQMRDKSLLKKEVCDMRNKMQEHLSNKNQTQFNIKTDKGGIADIEFISQYLVLHYAYYQPQMTKWSDNVRIFELAEKYHIIPSEEAKKLTEIYIDMRNEIHRLSLQLLPSEVDNQLFKQQQQTVIDIWQKWLLSDHFI